jgi:hypothetical protein
MTKILVSEMLLFTVKKKKDQTETFVDLLAISIHSETNMRASYTSRDQNGGLPFL